MISIKFNEHGRKILTITDSNGDTVEPGSTVYIHARVSMFNLLSRTDDVPIPEQYQSAFIDGVVNSFIKKFIGTTRTQLEQNYQSKKQEWLAKSIGQRTGNRLRLPFTRIRPAINSRIPYVRGNNE